MRRSTLFAFDRLSLRDLAELCTRVTDSTRGTDTMEDAATALVRSLREAFVDPDSGRTPVVLARAFQTTTVESLPADLRERLAERAPEEATATARCLALLGTDGDLPAWRDRRRSRDHQVSPLSSVHTLADAPMVAALVEHFGVSPETFVHGGAAEESADDDFEVFFVPEAEDSPEVPAQDFVQRHGVRSVLGFGGLLPGGDVFSIILFSRVPIPTEVAGLFRTVAVAARLGLLTALAAPLFRGQSARPANPVALAATRIRALEQMLDVQQQTVADQATHLEEALQDAVASRNQAQREVAANELLRQVTTMLSAELDVDRLVQAATDAATEIAGAAFGAFFYNVVRDGEEYMLYTLSGLPRREFAQFPMPRPTAIFRPTFEGAAVIRSADITKDRRYGHNPPHHGLPVGHPELRSFLAVPVVARNGEVHGGFFFGHPDVGVFDDRAERLVVGIAAQTAIALDNARLYQAERRTALTLQRSLLPQVVDVPEGLEIGYEYQPGGGGVDVGGDWFDVIPLPAGRTAFVIGDVMGRGVRAAAVMGQLRSAIRAYTVGDLPPDVLLERLNALVLDMGEDLIATCTYAILDQTQDTVTFASAGHLPPLVLGTGHARLLDQPAGPPLGVPDAVHRRHSVALPVGHRMLLFTDGLVEDRNRPLDEGLARMTRTVQRLDGSSDVVCKELIASMHDPDAQADDVTVLLVANTGLARQEQAAQRFPPDPRAAAEARRFLSQVLAGWGDDHLSEPVVTAVNEMFINALAHAQTPITLRVRRLPRVLVAEVEDLDARPPRRRAADLEEEGRRGLHIVAALADRWGTRSTETGKVVWAEFSAAPQ